MGRGGVMGDDGSSAPAGYRDRAGRHGPVVLPARPEPIAFDPASAALVVVDMQNAYASPGGYLDLAGFDVSATGPVIARIALAVAAARAAGIPVLWFQNGWDPDYAEAGGPGSPNWHKSNALKTMRANPRMNARLLARGSWDHALVDGLRPEPGDLLMGKPRYSGFANTALESTLRARGVNTLVFVGIATNVCVESTLRDGFHREFFGIVLADATHQAGPESLQAAALANIATFFGWVSDVDAFAAALSSAPPAPDARAAAE